MNWWYLIDITLSACEKSIFSAKQFISNKWVPFFLIWNLFELYNMCLKMLSDFFKSLGNWKPYKIRVLQVIKMSLKICYFFVTPKRHLSSEWPATGRPRQSWRTAWQAWRPATTIAASTTRLPKNCWKNLGIAEPVATDREIFHIFKERRRELVRSERDE